MFKKVLVANRGEIAVRILRACEERGLQTVAVYSEADRNALHVRYANEAFLIGPPPSSQSYLRIDKIIDVAKRSGADAIHPGYGFLAENDEFAQACVDEGIAFIGPTPENMRAMGDKVTARQTMIAAGVPVVPGSAHGLRDDEVAAEAQRIGLPVLIKASAGGGGKGMRVVRDESELQRSLGAARREAMSAFGDDTVYLEKLIERPRHIEIQILADSHGNVIHLGERECSIQRRHQKLIEESPSVAVDEALRQKMGELSVQAARAVNYVSAGTLEFLLDQSGNFYFLEMNTRLQVEHPVTERVTGVDIVKEMITIAAGRRMRLKQEDIRPKGWAIECRITAEDPINNFMPSGGKITTLQEPTGPGVRVESGIYEGFEVSLFYDPMIAKLICWGETRAEALLRMRRALNEYRIGGIKTSIPFHQQIMSSAQFMWGTFDTNFLEERFSMTYTERPEMELSAAIAAALVAHTSEQRATVMHHTSGSTGSAWKRSGGWKR
ncbi:MAG: acetyl-CoA carboxylase biotin carboxylase subunit [Anaerolineae bacterium]|nr:acetyl-CoA carboxylase biotin carboxylase subunit [Anaerolineae bacterium]MCB9130571.1 acetyl-CoA carboxylase biotin carboxylase subunit [Anaerolineales bacterium]MCB0238823.1 acetyl-CoA carboxylase biotin carboxylase subunit [Anaerolineae bacterium]MCB0241800.1 acetyl-CoA carboxylase biotin carboxylase subunit [Anaerolineae bacterium]MCB0250602.1 acetyl-CoA carboxylase biotin carboxylase subunit [Anaerolineae bacterium]